MEFDLDFMLDDDPDNIPDNVFEEILLDDIFIDEEETLPVFSTMIAIPNRGGVDLLVSNSSKSSSFIILG